MVSQVYICEHRRFGCRFHEVLSSSNLPNVGSMVFRLSWFPRMWCSEIVSMAPQVNEIAQLMFVPPNLADMVNHMPYLGDLGAINGWTYNFSHWLGSPTIFCSITTKKNREPWGYTTPPKKPLELHCWSRPKAKMRGPGKSSMQNASRAWQERSWELGWYPMVDPQSSPWVSILSHGHELDDLEVPSYFGKPAYNLYNHCPRGKNGEQLHDRNDAWKVMGWNSRTVILQNCQWFQILFKRWWLDFR